MKFFNKEKEDVRAQYAMDKLLLAARTARINGAFLDIGCGDGAQTEYVRKTGIFDKCQCVDVHPGHSGPGHIRANFMKHQFDTVYDVVWASHVLEHVRNPILFLGKVRSVLRENGFLGIVVPPFGGVISSGHVTIWTPGLLLLNLVKAGFDCSNAGVCQQGYNIAVVLQKKSCRPTVGFDPDIDGNERSFLPKKLEWFMRATNGVWYFKDNFAALNWD